VLRSAQLAAFLDGSSKAPADKIKIKIKSQKGTEANFEEVLNRAYEAWKAQEQQVLSYLLTSVSRDILVQIATLPSATAVWSHIETSFASQSRARVINTRMALATSQKGGIYGGLSTY
jgi:hypothetical protein